MAIKVDPLVETALLAALEAGKEILNIYSNPDFGIEYKKDNSPLTMADKKAHRAIVQLLEKTNIPILSEEGTEISYNDRKNWKTFWMVDPLDGTKEFIKKNGEFTVNIALIENEKPILGVVYAPVLNKVYFNNGNQAYLLKNIDVSTSKEDLLHQIQQKSLSLPLQNHRDGYVVVTSRSHLSKKSKDFIKKLEKEMGNIEIISVGSSLKLCLIAEGKADIYPRYAPTMEWDIAAGHAIVEASGGKVLQAEKNTPLVYNKENQLNPWFIATK